MLQKRKQLRLPDYDYAQNGCYFVTVCTKDRRPILGGISEWNCCDNSSVFSRPCIVDENGSFLPLDANGDAAPVGFDAHIEPSVRVNVHVEPPVGVDAHIDPQIRLSYYGQIVERYLRSIPGIYAYAIMPNHVHLMINISDDRPCNGPMWASAPTSPVQSVGIRVRSFKTLTSKAVGFSVWQRSFYDHVIRSEAEALRVLQYIQTNPARWADDEYYQI